MEASAARIISSSDQLPINAGTARYLGPLMRDGAACYVENVNLAVRALSVDVTLLPLIVNPGKRAVSDICSPYAHYFMYTVEEFRKSHSAFSGFIFRVLTFPFGVLLRACDIDHAIFINNWLFTTNPGPSLSNEKIGAATDLLLREYPDFAIVLRSVNSLFDHQLQNSLVCNGYRLVRSRRVYVIDCTGKRALRHNNIQIDLKLLKKSSYRVLDCHESLQKHVSRMAELYRGIYLSKHSTLNPQFTSEFFLLTLKERIFAYRALEKDGRIDGFVTFFVQDDRLTGAVLGYDLNSPQEIGLYRMLIAILISEAAQRNLHLNLSGGAGRFKLLRGAVPIDEYDAIYDRHLPAYRRLAWTTLKITGRLSSRRNLSD